MENLSIEKKSLNANDFTVAPPPALFAKVMGRIDQEMRVAAIKKKLVIFSALLFGSMAASFPMWAVFKHEVLQSGFIQYAALLFSDFRTTVTYWQDFWLTLLETLPALSLAGALSVLLVILASLRSVIRYVHMISHLSHPPTSV